MAYPLVQSNSGSFTAATTTTLSFTNNVQAGSAIFVAMGITSLSNIFITPTDSQGNTYVAYIGAIPGAVGTLFCYVAKNVQGGPITVTVSTTGSTNMAFIIAEYRSLNSIAATLSGGADSATSPTGSSSTTTVSTTAVTTTQLNDLVAIIAINNSSATYSSAAGWQDTLNSQNGTFTIGLSTIFSGAAGSSITPNITSSGAVAARAAARPMFTTFQQTNNYQQLKVGDGMSVSEKIR